MGDDPDPAYSHDDLARAQQDAGQVVGPSSSSGKRLSSILHRTARALEKSADLAAEHARRRARNGWLQDAVEERQSAERARRAAERARLIAAQFRDRTP